MKNEQSRLNLYLDKSLKKKLKLEAVERGLSLKDLLNEILEKWFKKGKKWAEERDK